jgi:hypothetical protein
LFTANGTGIRRIKLFTFKKPRYRTNKYAKDGLACGDQINCEALEK